MNQFGTQIKHVKYMITGGVLLAAVTVDALARRQRERVQVT
jgi:ABC-type xylose transport system permease subunit